MANRCATHSSNTIQSFCKNCNKLVCLRCMEGDIHKGHEYTNLQDLLEKRQKNLHTVENLEIDVDARADAEQQKIVQRAETLQLNIADLKTKFSDEIKAKVNLHKESLAIRKKEYQDEIRFLEKIIEPSTSSEDEANVGETNIYHMSSSPPHDVYFVPRFQYDNESEVSEVFGNLQGEVLDSGDADVEDVGKESFNQDDAISTGSVRECSVPDTEIDRNGFTLKSQGDGVVRICTSSFQNSWIATCGAKEIALYAKDGSHIKTIKARFKVFDISIHEKKVLYATEMAGRHVRKCSIDAAILMWTKLKSFPVGTETYGIHVNDSGDIWVCLRRKDLERKLVRISESCVAQVIEFSSEGTELFNCPTFVHQNNCTGDIMVVDGNTVVVLNKVGCYKFNITGDNLGTTGQNMDVSPGKFIPLGLLNDKEGNIIISDVGNNRVWMFDKDGVSLRCLGEEFYGLSGIALHLEEEIWVAVSNRKITFIKL